jgi:regulation of enolase protein 1 (concanavalin A-like superfamily)
MNAKLIVNFIYAALLMLLFMSAGKDGIGMFEDAGDVGNPRLKGNAVYDAPAGRYMLTGAGENVWAESDEFYYVWRKATGNFSLSAKVVFKGEGANEHRKIGIMIRESLTGESRYADVAVHGDGLTSLQYRPETGQATKEVVGPPNGVNIYLERKGDKIIMKTAAKGAPKDVTGEIELRLPPSCYVGLYVCSHEDGVLETAYFSDVKYRPL